MADTLIPWIAKMTQQIECVICFDVIGDTNNIITECGHKFHASCLMTNITRNGFNCPCCRALMAEELDDESTIYDETDSETTNSGTNDTETSEDYDEEFSLRGLRFFTNRLEGEENDEDDIQDEEEDIEYSYPSTEYITDRLLLDHNVTMEHLVAALIQTHWTGRLPEEYQSSQDIPRLIRDELRNFLNTLSINIPLPFAETVVVPADDTHIRRPITERLAPVNPVIPIAIPVVAEEKIPIRIMNEVID